MLARTSTIRHRPSGVTLQTPLLIPSFSSKGFARSKSTGKSEIGEIVATASEFITETCLISAYDIFYEHLPLPPELPCVPELVFLDSGGYEISQDRDYSSVIDPLPAPQSWDVDKYASVLNAWPEVIPAVFASYDHHEEPKPFLDQADDARSLFKSHNNQLHLLLLKPEKDTQKTLDAALKSAIANIDELGGFDVIGVTEKELGHSFLDRMTHIARLRQAMDHANIEIPIHVFGALDPVSVSLYFLAGAEMFDGLTWLRYGYHQGVALYLHNLGALEYGIHASDNQVKLRAMTGNIYELQELQHRMREFLTTQDFSKFARHEDVVRQAADRLGTRIAGAV